MEELNEHITPFPQFSWPQRLKEIPQPPKEMWMNGTLPSFEHVWLTVVGSRKATEYGTAACKELIQSLAGLPVVIVSGLALGIDAIAHQAALEAGLACVAIPGSGLHSNVLAPAQNHKLAKQIIKNNGCLLSPFPSKYPAAPYTFPTRNRIMVGLSHAVLIIEATEKSGTLITARMASDYNRDVGVVPGSIFSPGSIGPHQFLSLGATPIFDAASLHSFLRFDAHVSVQQSPSEHLSEHEKTILDSLNEPLTKSALRDKTNLPQTTFNETITLLEIKGLISDILGYVQRRSLPK